MTFDFTVPGKPVGKGRPRFAQGRTFTPHETVVAEQAIRHAWHEAGAVRLPDGPVCMEITLAVTRPRGHYRSDGIHLNTAGLRAPFPHRQKPDLDNAVKLVMDALNTVAYSDDVQVVDIFVKRMWASEPYTRVTAWSMNSAANQLDAERTAA